MDGEPALLGFSDQPVDARVRHRHRHVDERRGDVAERLEGRLAVGRVVPGPHEHDGQRHRADQLGRDERCGRKGHQERDRAQLLGGAGGDRHEAAQDLLGRRHEQRTAEDLADRVELELEAGHDAEVAAAATDRPEEVGVRILAGGDLAAVGRHDLDRLEGIDGQAVLAHQPADPATERQAGDADRTGVAERRRETMGRDRVRVFAGGQAGLRPGDLAIGIDVEALHRAEVEDDPAVVGAVAGEAVAAAANRQRETGFASQDDGPGDVGRIGRTDDECGATVVDRAVDLAGDVVVGAAGQDDRAVQTGLEGFEVERVVEVGAGGAEGFHRGGSLVVVDSVGGAPIFGSTQGPGQRTADGWPAWTSVHKAGDGCRARYSAGRVSRIRIATITPDTAVRAATARIATRASNLSARSPTRIAPTANPMSRQKR